MSHLTYLIDEICAGVEIYYTGRTGGQYMKTAFILCDDYTELTSKLFLLHDDRKWSDRKGDKFKNYHDVQSDVRDVFKAKHLADLARIEALHTAMAARRERRNDFFHSTKLLDLNVTARMCVEAFCDLLEYGQLLFQNDWKYEVELARNLDTLEIMLRLEKKGFSDPSITPKVSKIIADWPRNIADAGRKGVHLTKYPEDLHLRLCVIYGRKDLRDKLSALLP